MARFYAIMDAGGLDVKLGLRLMRKSWGLTLVGGVAMALTIGLGTAIFTLWNTATTTTLPLPDGDRIVAIQSSDAATGQIHRDSSLPDFRRWRELLRSVTDVSAMRLRRAYPHHSGRRVRSHNSRRDDRFRVPAGARATAAGTAIERRR